MLQVRGMDHIVLVVADVANRRGHGDRPAGGGAPSTDGKGASPRRQSSTRSERSLVRYCGELGLSGEGQGRNLDHLCLMVEPVDLDALKASGRFRVVAGPVPRWGARGTGTSVYVLDPDDNLVELRHYG